MSTESLLFINLAWIIISVITNFIKYRFYTAGMMHKPAFWDDSLECFGEAVLSLLTGPVLAAVCVFAFIMDREAFMNEMLERRRKARIVGDWRYGKTIV